MFEKSERLHLTGAQVKIRKPCAVKHDYSYPATNVGNLKVIWEVGVYTSYNTDQTQTYTGVNFN